MNGRPLEDKAACATWDATIDDTDGIDTDDDFELTIPRVEVRRRVISIVH